MAKAEVISMLDYEDDKSYVQHFTELSQMQGKIQLYLNPNEADQLEVIELLEDVRELIHKENWSDKVEEDLSAAIDDLLEVSRKVLRREWKKVLKGE